MNIPSHESRCSLYLADLCPLNCPQVIQGGNYDVDMELTGPNGQILYKDVKKQYDSFTWTTDIKGDYKFCFSNEFSTYTHKIVYLDFQVGDEDPMGKEMGEHATAMTQVSLWFRCFLICFSMQY